MNSPVDKPFHYTPGGIECIEAIGAVLGKDGFAAYCKGNVLKYIWRAGKKDDELQDLKKARWYLDRLIGVIDD